jgi:hypothetical protein
MTPGLCIGSDCCGDNMFFTNDRCVLSTDETTEILDINGVSPFIKKKMNKINNFCRLKCKEKKNKKRRKKCRRRCREEELIGGDTDEIDEDEEDEEEEEDAAYILKSQKLRVNWENVFFPVFPS